ncbi:MAG: class I SAM-dependent methyltransferase [Acidimicrobiales bacterium]
MGDDYDGTRGHYFDEHPDVASRPRTYEMPGPHGPLRVTTDTGVFSHGRLDRGTELLLTHPSVPPLVPGTGDVVDLGCGSGPVALWLAALRPACTVWAVDTNERALTLTEGNARDNALGNIRTATPSSVPADLRVAAIVSNPPVRIGKQALHTMLDEWMSILLPGGVVVLVVGRNLGADSLQRWLEECGRPTERLASSGGFRLLCSRIRTAEG